MEKLEIFKIAKELFIMSHPISAYTWDDIENKYLDEFKKFVDKVFDIYTKAPF